MVKNCAEYRSKHASMRLLHFVIVNLSMINRGTDASGRRQYELTLIHIIEAALLNDYIVVFTDPAISNFSNLPFEIHYDEFC